MLEKQKQSPAEIEMQKRTLTALTRVHQKAFADLNLLLKPFDLSEPLFNILRILRGAGPEGLPVNVIISRVVTRVPDMTRLLDRLEKLALISRERSKADRRVVQVFITPRGLDVLRKLDEPVDEFFNRFLSNLTVNEQKQLALLLEKAQG